MADPNQAAHLQATHHLAVIRHQDTHQRDTHHQDIPLQVHLQEGTMVEEHHQVAAAIMVGPHSKRHQVAMLQVVVVVHPVLQKANKHFQHHLLTTTMLEEGVVEVALQLQLLEARTPMPTLLLHLPVATTVEAAPMVPTVVTRVKLVLVLKHPLVGAPRMMVRPEVALLLLVHMRVTTKAATAVRVAVMGAVTAMTTTVHQAIHVAHLLRSHAATPLDTHRLQQQHRLDPVEVPAQVVTSQHTHQAQILTTAVQEATTRRPHSKKKAIRALRALNQALMERHRLALEWIRMPPSATTTVTLTTHGISHTEQTCFNALGFR